MDYEFQQQQKPYERDLYRIINFSWIVLENCLLSWENILKGGMITPNHCAMCGLDEETIFHLFVSCHFSISIFHFLVPILK